MRYFAMKFLFIAPFSKYDIDFFILFFEVNIKFHLWEFLEKSIEMIVFNLRIRILF